jgi:tetratricopeptide (TPR) repeat protein
VSQGNTDTNAGDHDRAIAAYSEAIRLDPKNAIAFNNRGNAYGKKGWTTGDYDRAVADYSEAIRLDPQYASAFCNRGRTKLSIKDSGGDEDVAKARQLDASVCR